MSKQTDFARDYIAWREGFRYQDTSPEAFEEVQRLAQVDRRVDYLFNNYTVEDWLEQILLGTDDNEVNEWHGNLVSGGPEIVVTEEDIEDVPLD